MAKTVLVVDDDAFFRSWAQDALASEGLEVVVADGGKAALAHLAESTVDVILVDMMMPEMLGTELCRDLRRDVQLGEIPVILTTAWGAELSDLGVLEADHRADSLLHKPISVKALRREVARWAKTGRPRIPDPDDERRASARVPIDVDAKLVPLVDEQMQAPLAECRLVDISETGAYILTSAVLPKGQDCLLWMVLPDEHGTVHVRARVVRSTQSPEPGVGVFFEDLGADQMRALREYVETLRRFVMR